MYAQPFRCIGDAPRSAQMKFVQSDMHVTHKRVKVCPEFSSLFLDVSIGTADPSHFWQF